MADNTEDTGGAKVNPLLGSLSSMLGGKPAVKTAPPVEVASTAAPAERTPVPKAPAKADANNNGNNNGVSETSVPTGALYTVVTRNEFYRDGFRNLIILAVVEAAIILALIVTIGVQLTSTKSVDRYFATTADGRIMQLVPMDRPNMSTAALMSWVAQAASEVMTFGFHDYQRRLQQSSRYFTRSGWESFTSALQKSRILDAIQAQQQVVSATPSSAPVLVQQGVLNGKYRWIIQMPIQVTYRAAAGSRTDKMKLNLVVERVPSLENPYGVGIEQWIAVQE